MITNATEPLDIIWLQPDDNDLTTCCQDKINNDDIKYLLATPEREAAEATQKTLKKAMAELGIPNKDYPAPVSNAYEILKTALTAKEQTHEN